MPTPTKGARLGAGPAHERLMLANLATSLFQHGRIHTTAAKAKRLRPYAERLITKAKRGDLHNRRQIMRVIRDKEIVHRLITELVREKTVTAEAEAARKTRFAKDEKAKAEAATAESDVDTADEAADTAA